MKKSHLTHAEQRFLEHLENGVEKKLRKLEQQVFENSARITKLEEKSK